MSELDEVRGQLTALKQTAATFRLAQVVQVVGSTVTVDIPAPDGSTVRAAVPCPPQFVPEVGQKVTLRMAGHTPTVVAEQLSPIAVSAAGPVNAAVGQLALGLVTPQFTAINQSMTLIRARLDSIEARLAAAGIP